MRALLEDLRYAARSLIRSPGFTAVAVLTLGIGLGGVGAMFSMVDAILIRPLPYPDADRLVVVRHAAPGLNMAEAGQSDGTYLHYRAHNRVFEEIGTYYENVVNLSDSEEAEAERVAVALVSHTVFPVLGARAALGRLPTPDDARAEGFGDVVVLISHDLWQRRYGGDPDIVGARIELNRVPRRVLGVLEPRFDFPRREIAVWYPMDPDPATARFSDLVQSSVARLKPGVTREAAEADLNGLIPSLPDVYPDVTSELLREAGLRAVVEPLKHAVVGDAAAALWLLLGGMGFLLLIAWANLVNLLMARREHRHREMAIRSALGARRKDVARHVVAEGALLGLVGAALALLLAFGAVSLLRAHGPAGIPRLTEVGPGARAAALTAALGLVTGLVSAALSMARPVPRLTASLRETAVGPTPGRARQRARRLLVAGQVALALTLLVGSTLMLKSFWHLTNVDPGFDADSVLTAEIAMPRQGYETYDRARGLWDQLLERVRMLPGVEAAGAVTAVPLVPVPGYFGFELDVERQRMKPHDARPTVRFYTVTPGYFEAMRIPVERGELPWLDVAAPEHPVVLSSGLARKLYGQDDPIGERLRRHPGAARPWNTVAALVADVPAEAVAGDAAEIVYLPVLERSVDGGLIPSRMTLVVRTSVPPASLAPAVRRVLRELDPDLPLTNVRTMDRIVADSMARTRFTMLLLVVAATAALFLGAVGVYGVVSYTVGRRTHEIGVRMALGARAADVRSMVLREGAALALGGVALGIVTALALTRFLRSLLYEVTPTDPASFAGTVLLVLGMALLASYLPARRATRVDPMIALRED